MGILGKATQTKRSTFPGWLSWSKARLTLTRKPRPTEPTIDPIGRAESGVIMRSSYWSRHSCLPAETTRGSILAPNLHIFAANLTAPFISADLHYRHSWDFPMLSTYASLSLNWHLLRGLFKLWKNNFPGHFSRPVFPNRWPRSTRLQIGAASFLTVPSKVT